MLVRCLEHRIDWLTDSALRAHVREYVHLDSIGLEAGKCYHVFGVSFRGDVPWYLLCEDIADGYPVPYCSAFFELVDGSIDAGWSLSLSHTNIGDVSILPNKWAADDRFLERLVDGELNAVSYFNDLKALVDDQPST